jgi:hypothetical protein
VSLKPNMPTPDGIRAGQELVRLFFPPFAVERFQRCTTCAFRLGTIPNGCLSTIIDALECVVKREHFYCHSFKDDQGQNSRLCAGWLQATSECDPSA